MREAGAGDPGARRRTGRWRCRRWSAPGGGFHFTVPASDAGDDYRIEVAGPTGAVEGTASFTARQDAVAPEIALDAPPPAATAKAGSTSPAAPGTRRR